MPESDTPGSTPTSNTSLLVLPNEVILEIGRALPNRDLSRLLRANRFINTLLDSILWNSIGHEVRAVDVLIHAAKTGNLLTARKLFKMHSVDPNEKNDDAELPLGGAVENNHPAMVEYLLEVGAKINGTAYNKPLRNAIRNKKNEMVSILLDYCYSVPDIRVCCKIAVASDNMEALYMLLGRKPYDDVIYCSCLLNEAAAHGRMEAAEMIIYECHIGSVDSPDIEGYTPLHYAVGHGHLDMVRLLIENGANLKATPTYNAKITPLRLARKEGFDEIAKVLLDAGAQDESWDDEDDESLYWH